MMGRCRWGARVKAMESGVVERGVFGFTPHSARHIARGLEL